MIKPMNTSNINLGFEKNGRIRIKQRIGGYNGKRMGRENRKADGESLTKNAMGN